MAIKAQATVDTPCSDYKSMQEDWDLIDDLVGGTKAMRKAGEKWLPREPKEDDQSYKARLGRSILFSGYEDTVDDLASRPFVRPVTLQGEVPEELAYLSDNCDGQGTDLTQFAREMFNALLNRGITHILIDYPALPQDQKLTLAEEKQIGVRPYFVHIKADQLIGWHIVTGIDGKPKISMIRWKTTTTEPDSAYGEVAVDEIRVMTETTWEVHRKNEKNEYVLFDQGEHTYPEGIPLYTCYIKKKALMTAMPPMLGLAWMNLAHWQSYSDQRNLLRFVRFPLLFFKGLSPEELENDVVIGPGRKFSSGNPDADAKYIEHTGNAVTCGREDLKDIEERMTTLGMEPLLDKPGNQTATGQAIDESKSQSSIQSWIRSLEKAIKEAYRMAGVWIGVELPEDFKADIFNDFGVSLRATTDIDALIKIRQAKEIDRETFLREIKRRALLSDNTDIAQVIEAVDAEGPAGGTLTGDMASMSDEELAAIGVPPEAIAKMHEKMAGMMNT